MKSAWAEVGNNRERAADWYRKYTNYTDDQIEQFIRMIECRHKDLEPFDTEGIESIALKAHKPFNKQ